jgi:hypothetical protein
MDRIDTVKVQDVAPARSARALHDVHSPPQDVPLPVSGELFGRLARAEGIGHYSQRAAHRTMGVTAMSSETRASGSGDWDTAGTGSPRGQRSPMAWQVLSALLLLAMGGIHLYLVINGVGGVLGVLFLLNAAGALVLAIAMVVLRRLLLVASLLSLLFMAGTLLALVLALTVGLFGIRETLDFQLVPTALVVESVGTIVLGVTTALVARLRRAA